MMGNEEKSEDGDSSRMSSSQVKKYLNFAESKTKIRKGNGLSAISIKGHTKEMHKKMRQSMWKNSN